ncbi:hypothetical protein [Hydrogenophaga sp.]|jgi:hypothetical protein|nr:hypothetical protein [Hydrogenophaga sp.]
MKPASISSRVARCTTSCDFQPRFFMCAVDASNLPLLSRTN